MIFVISPIEEVLAEYNSFLYLYTMLDKKLAHKVETRKSKSGSTYKVYHFSCSECNKGITAQISHLKRHSGKCIRCGHLGKPYMYIFNELKNHHNKNVPVSLTYEELVSLINSEPKCHYCNEDLIYNKHSRNWGETNSRAYQLDRKDNSKGYDLDNVVTCCWDCNRLKSDRFSYEEFMRLSPILKDIRTKRLKL